MGLYGAIGWGFFPIRLSAAKTVCPIALAVTALRPAQIFLQESIKFINLEATLWLYEQVREKMS